MLRLARMGVGRLSVGVGVLTVAIVAACSNASTEPTVRTEEVKGEPPRVPDPPPRYAHSDPGPSSSGGSADPDAGKIYECGGRTPFACPLEDGTFVCSDTPCLPDCTRIGCVGGDVCRACDGGHRCVDPTTGC